MPVPAILSRDELAGVPLAYLAYAAHLPSMEATDWLSAFLARPDWRTYFSEWVNAAGLVGYRAPDDAKGCQETLSSAIADALEQRPIDASVHDGLGQLNISYRFFLRPRSPSRARIARWIAQTGGAADAAAMVNWIHHSPNKDDADEGAEVAPLVEIGRTLLERGSSELRRADRAELTALLVRVMDDYSTPELRELALRVFVRNERPAGSHMGATFNAIDRKGGTLDMVVPALERTLAAGAAPSLAVDVAITLGFDVTLRHVLRQDGLPLTGCALLAHAAQDPEARSRAATLKDLFEIAVKCDRWEPPVFGGAAALGVAVDALNHLGSDRSLTTSQLRRLDAWAENVADQHFALHGLSRGGAPHQFGSIERLVGWDATRDAAVRALRRALEQEPGEHARLSRRILDQHRNDPHVALAALYALPAEIERVPVAPGGPALSVVERELGRLLIRSWLDPVAGVDVHALLRGVRRLELAQLPDERLCIVSGDVVQFSADEVAKLVRGEVSGERALAIAALYVTHELVHVAQGAGGKSTIDRLRAAGGETTLLHLDLAADHAAACVVRHMRPDWSLGWLKALHGENASRYPVSRWHVAAARARKALRLVGLRTDLVVRTDLPDVVGDDEYAFADFGPAGGSIVILASGPPWRVLGIAPLSPDDARVLGAAADQREPLTGAAPTFGQEPHRPVPSLEQIDAALRRLLAAARAAPK